jgi:hypothetical protein
LISLKSVFWSGAGVSSVTQIPYLPTIEAKWGRLPPGHDRMFSGTSTVRSGFGCNQPSARSQSFTTLVVFAGFVSVFWPLRDILR